MGLFDDLSDDASDLGGGVSKVGQGVYGDGSFLNKTASVLGFGPKDHDADHAAEDLLNQQRHAYDDIQAPNLSPVSLKDVDYAGDVNPQNVDFGGATAALEGPSALGNISSDPRLRDAQMKALASMQGIADSGGLVDADKANLARIQSQASTADAARRNAILQNMHERGLGGSGSELLAQLSSSQAATDQQAQAGLDVAGQAQNRALQAMQGAGTAAGALRGQDYGEQSNAAQAADAIARFNATNQTSMNEYNNTGAYQAGLANAQFGQQAAMDNQAVRQGVNNANTGIRNQQATYNAQLPQQNFGNLMGIASAKAGGLQNSSNYYGQKGNVAAQTQAGLQSAVIGGTSQMAGSYLGRKPGAAEPAAGGSSGAGGQALAGGDVADAGAIAAMGWKGGRIPGTPSVPGNSPANDVVPTLLSPGEVVLPRSVASNPSKVPGFVKHAPNIASADKNKEAMLSALSNIRRRNQGAA